MDWILDPLVSVGPLRFGMSPDEVAKVIGPPEDAITAEDQYQDDPYQLALFTGYAWEHRAHLDPAYPELSYCENKLIEVDIWPDHGPLILDGKSLFKSRRKDVLRFLFSKGGDVYKNFGAVLFTSLGITLAPPRYAREEPSITVFAEGAFDPLIQELGYKKVTSPEQLGV
ncbi:MAG: hypothetical protein ACFB2Z_06880 [Maricaulaceae bacterium]